MKTVLLGLILVGTSAAYAAPGVKGMALLSENQQTVLKALKYNDAEVFYEGNTLARQYRTNVPNDLDTYEYIGKVAIPCVVSAIPFVENGNYYGLIAEIDTPRFLIDENVGGQVEKVRWGHAEGFGASIMLTEFSQRNVSEKLTTENNTIHFEYLDTIENLTKVVLKLDQNKNLQSVEVSEYETVLGVRFLNKNQRHSLSCHNLKRIDKKRFLEIINSEM